jgi:hypothetical protein
MTLGVTTTTLTLSNPIEGGVYTIKIVQDATTAPRTVVWPAAVKWPGGITPLLSTGTSDVDIITLIYDGTNYYGSSQFNFA